MTITYTCDQDELVTISNLPTNWTFVIQVIGSNKVYALETTDSNAVTAEGIGYSLFGVNNPLPIGYGYAPYEAGPTYNGQVDGGPSMIYVRCRQGGISFAITPKP